MEDFDFKFNEIMTSKNVFDGLGYLLTRANHIKDIAIIDMIIKELRKGDKSAKRNDRRKHSQT